MSTERRGDFEALIRRTLEQRIREVAEEEATKAGEAVKERVRKELAAMTLSVLSFYSVQRIGEEIVIHVKNTA